MKDHTSPIVRSSLLLPIQRKVPQEVRTEFPQSPHFIHSARFEWTEGNW